MNAAREQEIKEQIRSGLRKLASGAVCTRAEAFGKMSDRSADYMRISRILKALAQDGLIESSDAKPGEPTLHLAKDTAKLETIASSDLELARLIWPGRSPPRAEPDAYLEGIMARDMRPMAPPIAASPAESEPTAQEVAAATFKMVVAISEIVIELRTKVDALHSVACAHCECPEAHGL